MKLWFLVPLLALSLCACNPQDASDLGDSVEDLAKTSAKAAGNASVAGKVNLALSLRKGVHMEFLHIEAKGGTVTVGGHVTTKAEHDLILKIAQETRGVEKVIDDLRIEPE